MVDQENDEKYVAGLDPRIPEFKNVIIIIIVSEQCQVHIEHTHAQSEE